jgi:hypothetical protein
VHSKLLTISERWELSTIIKTLKDDAEDPRITIGLLGHFSSGKSTLINELVAQPDLMAVRLEPCTASAGLVLSVKGTTEVTCFRLMPDQTLEEITRGELDDVARGKGTGRPVVYMPPNDHFPAGLGLADTPGLDSMNQDHLDTTLAELPYLDAVIICIDIQKGGLTKSVLEFLQSPGIRHLQHRFLIALTHGDLKGQEAIREIRASTAQRLAEQMEISSEEAASRVVVVAGGGKAHERGKADVTELRLAMQSFVIDKKRIIHEERRTRSAARLIPKMELLLRERLQLIRGEGSELTARAEQIEESIKASSQTKQLHKERLHRFQDELRREVSTTCEGQRSSLSSASTTDQLARATAALTAAVDATIRRCVGEYYESFTSGTEANVGAITAHLQSMNRGADISKTIATAALTAWLIPNPAGAAGLAANAGQAGGGAAIRRAGAAGAAAAQQIPKIAIGKQVLVSVFKTIDDINPINYAGDIIAQRIKKQTLDSYLEELARSVSQQACRKLEAVFKDDVFGPQEDIHSELKEVLKKVQEDRTLKNDDQTKRLRKLESDLATLSVLAIQ